MPLAVDMPTNGPREHYMRARITGGAVTPDQQQDSALLGVLARADALLVRPPNDPAQSAGAMVRVINL